MLKIVIIGSCKHGPYEIIAMPNMLNPELYEKNHEKAYEEACKTFYPAIDQCDEVWVYIPDGRIGEHTMRDLLYAVEKQKIVRVIRGVYRGKTT